MRIIAGHLKGRRLEAPSHGTRPTLDKIREAIFSRLENWDVVRDAVVLDLFAGSGSLALEALSRGAKCATLVEKSGKAAHVARRNITACGMGEATIVSVADASAFLHSAAMSPASLNNGHGYDLVFLDPPYHLTDEVLTDTLAALLPLLDLDATVVIERDFRSPEPTLPEGLAPISGRRWGDTTVWFVKVEGSET